MFDKKELAIQTGVYLGVLAAAYPVISGIESLLSDESFLQTLSNPATSWKAGIYAMAAVPLGFLSMLYTQKK